MDYKKKYEEALGWIKYVYPTMEGAMKEDAEHFFPELAESEDERIRRHIVTFLLEADKMGDAPEEVAKWLAYLEKQKPAEWSEEDEKHREWILECLASGEQKVPEYADQYRSAFNWLKDRFRQQPHWKPSKEQMDALSSVANFCDTPTTKIVKSLYNDIVEKVFGAGNLERI